MIKKNGKRVTYTDETKKARLDALKAETAKSKGKPVSSLTKKELENALAAALRFIDMADEQGVIK